jgi:phosphopantothenoylcysteine synthetase/decarboxylase
MKIWITCGAGSEPIDEVRRITNYSTGSLGLFLTNYFTARGHEITTFMARNRTCPGDLHCRKEIPFTSGAELLNFLQLEAAQSQPQALFHLAALGDFRVDEILDRDNKPLNEKKLSSSHPEIRLILKPAPKVIRQLRRIFPMARLIGWKYEVFPPGQEAVNRAMKQIRDCETDACVLNGPAVGYGYLFCREGSKPVGLPDRQALAEELASYLDI